MEPAESPDFSGNLPKHPHQGHHITLEHPENFLLFLKEGENPQISSSFFSKNGLSRDILQVTDAEPDICLEVFYALHITLWPQIEKLNERKKLGREQNKLISSLQDAWKNFLGSGISKGILCSPEKLLEKKKTQEIKEGLSKKGGEAEIFQDLDRVVNFIKQLKKTILDYPDHFIQEEEIIVSLDRVGGVLYGFSRENHKPCKNEPSE